MQLNRPIAALLTGLLAWSNVAAAAPRPKHDKPGKIQTTLTPNEQVLHVTSRLTFGATPELIQHIQNEGVNAWIEEQLHPENISDDGMAALLANYPAMHLNQQQLFADYPPPGLIRGYVKGNRDIALPTDPLELAIYKNQIANEREKLENKQEKQNAANGQSVPNAKDVAQSGMQPASMDAVAKQAVMTTQQNQPQDELSDAEKATLKADQQRILALPTPDARFAAIVALTPGEPRKFLQRMKPQERQSITDGMSPHQVEVLTALAQTQLLIATETMGQKLLYDSYSQRQLLEVMTDFWLNHFNVYLRKNEYAPWVIATYERDVIRPHAMGHFEDLLRATATSPAMMEYLDNFQSIGPDSQVVTRARQREAFQQSRGQDAPFAKKIADRGLNENYARELMELHTLGVDGGYTQRDVTEVAKVFTGWTVDQPQQGGAFTFDEKRHEPGSKSVLGKTIHENGQQEGFEVLHMLAMSPATARHLSRQLAVKFVSDNPPQSLVDRMSSMYLKTNGDIREVLRTMFYSPEFWSRDAYRAKVKTPLEFVVSAVRATGTDSSHPQALITALSQLGMPLYGDQPPTGYSNANDAWVSSAALITRMNFALALAANKLPKLTCDPAALVLANAPIGDADMEASLETVLLGTPASTRTRQTVLSEMTNLPEQEAAATQAAQQFSQPVQLKNTSASPDNAARGNDPLIAQYRLKRNAAITGPMPGPTGQVTQASIATGLLLGSPEFQRR